jgi:hypothetical protein
MTGSTTCNKVTLGQATADENYFTKRFKHALDGAVSLTDTNVKPPKYWDANKVTSVHDVPLNPLTDKSNLVTSMNTREAEVQKCVNELISYQELDNAQRTTNQATMQALEVAESQRQDALRSYNNMLSERDSKARIVEINTYYSKEYNAYTNILKIIFAFCIPLVILGMLNKEELIDDATYFRFSLLIIIIAVLMTAYRINDMYWRNNINYDNYEWLYSNPRKDDKLKRSLAGNEGIALSSGTATCQGAACCNSTTFWNGERCEVLPTHNYIGNFYYCVTIDGTEQINSVEFVPTTSLSGRVVGSVINGTYAVNRTNGSWASIVIDRPPEDFSGTQKSYNTSLFSTSSRNRIVFTDRTVPASHPERAFAPKHNDISTGTQWVSFDTTTPSSCSEITDA